MVEISLAPMIKVTTPQFRLLVRKISPRTVLFTEMIVDATVNHASAERLEGILGQPEPRTVVQIGGSEPARVADAVARLVSLGWGAFNLNCGCPSDRVQRGRFGAVLMRDMANVSAIVNAVHARTGCVLSLKIRTGVDELDSYEFFHGFVKHVADTSPCTRFYVHARKCWLQGLSPKQNRTAPPLNYQYVYDLKAAMPHLFICLNGGICDDGLEKLQNLDGLMIGRYAIEHVDVFGWYEEQLGGTDGRGDAQAGRPPIGAAVEEYLHDASLLGCSKSRALLPLVNILKGCPRSKAFKKLLAEMMHGDCSLEGALERIREYVA